MFIHVCVCIHLCVVCCMKVAESIRSMKVRGAPAIGCAAAYGRHTDTDGNECTVTALPGWLLPSGMALECLLIAKQEPSASGSTLKDKLQDTKKGG